MKFADYLKEAKSTGSSKDEFRDDFMEYTLEDATDIIGFILFSS